MEGVKATDLSKITFPTFSKVVAAFSLNSQFLNVVLQLEQNLLKPQDFEQDKRFFYILDAHIKQDDSESCNDM